MEACKQACAKLTGKICTDAMATKIGGGEISQCELKMVPPSSTGLESEGEMGTPSTPSLAGRRASAGQQKPGQLRKRATSFSMTEPPATEPEETEQEETKQTEAKVAIKNPVAQSAQNECRMNVNAERAELCRMKAECAKLRGALSAAPREEATVLELKESHFNQNIIALSV